MLFRSELEGYEDGFDDEDDEDDDLEIHELSGSRTVADSEDSDDAERDN